MKVHLTLAMCVVLSGSVAANAGEREQCSYGADLNLDGFINFADVLELLFHWGQCHVWNPDTGAWDDCDTQEDCHCAGDLSADDVVGFRDLLLMITKWGPVAECPECDDALDNDGDGLPDALDPGCWDADGVYDPELDDESIATTRCQDGIDNDGDGLVDFPDDPGCGNAFVDTEVEQIDPLGRPACSDGIDNDNDGTADWGQGGANDCFCSSPFDDSEQDVLLNEISWHEFPDFHLNENLTVVYGGLGLHPSQYYPEREDYGLIPLRRGFSHIRGRLVSPEYREELPVERRAGMWNPANSWQTGNPVNEENWEQVRSPWGNDMGLFEDYWHDEMTSLADLFADSRDTGVPNVEYLVADVERRWVSEEQMLGNRDDERIPQVYRNLPEDIYLDLYKHDMSALYDRAVGFPKDELGTSAKLTSYSEAPISNATFGRVGIRRYTWDEWTSDQSLIDYVLQDYEGDGDFGEFFSTLDFLAPSGYYFYDYPRTYEGNEDEWRNVGGYLSSNLFRIDVNRAWAPDKEIMIFQWMRLHGGGNCPECGIPRQMAHIAAILPFFSENVGTWVWDSDTYHNSNPHHPDITDEHQSQNRHAYNNFIYGLYRLSQYNAYFDEGYTVYHPTNARDLNANKLPIWRGIYSADGTRMLVAATNPYAAPGEVTEYVIEVDGNFIGTVETTGFNTYLGECDMVGGGCVGGEGMGVE